MIPKETIDRIFDTAKVEEVVGEFVSLKKRGVNYLGNCPFHNEKTPSFTVSPAKGIYKCFGCGAGGNSVNFLMELEQYSYVESLKYLAKKYGIEVVEESYSPEEEEKKNERDSLFNLNSFAQKNFTDNLYNNPDGKAIGLSYLRERGFRDDIIELFQLGFCLDEWTGFTDEATKNGYKLKYLVDSGLTVKNGDKQFDRFKGRVMFPIHNLAGRVAGFGGRILTNEKKTAKYLNSPDSIVYNKSRILYGINYARKKIIEKDNCYLVEGYTDVISLYQAGIENVVASSGTALTQDQIRLVKRFSNNITVLYDGDSAGIKASFRGIDMILKEDMNVRVLSFPEGEDPDSYSKNVSSSELQEFLDTKTQDFIKFKTKHLIKEVGDDPIKRANLIKDIIASISIVPDSIKRSIYVQECSQILNIDEGSLIDELNKLLKKEFFKAKTKKEDAPMIHEQTSKPQPKQEQPEANEFEYQEKDIVRLLINYANKEVIFRENVIVEDEVTSIKKTEINEIHTTVGDFIVTELINDKIVMINPVYQKIFQVFCDTDPEQEFPKQSFFTNNPDKEITETSVSLISTPYSLSENWADKYNIFTETEEDNLKKAIINSVYSLKIKKVNSMISDNENKMKSADCDFDEVLKNQLFLIEVKKQISQKLGRIIIK